MSQRAQEAEREYSTGESAFIYFTETIAERGAQLVIATHSPLLLSIHGAVIYDLDSRPVTVHPWYEPENVRLLHDFFLQHRDLFS